MAANARKPFCQSEMRRMVLGWRWGVLKSFFRVKKSLRYCKKTLARVLGVGNVMSFFGQR